MSNVRYMSIAEELLTNRCCKTCKHEYYSPMTNCYLEDGKTLCSNKDNCDGGEYKVVCYDSVCDKWRL